MEDHPIVLFPIFKYFFFFFRTFDTKFVVMRPCENVSYEDRWDLTADGHLKHQATGLCIDHEHLDTKKFLYVTDCDSNSLSQKWTIEH
jgi:hypothetical protein